MHQVLKTKWTRYALFGVVCGILFFSSAAHAVLTKQLSFQGRLQDASGQPVANGTYSVVFSIYNVPVGGAPLWTETQSVNVEKGGFSVYLGSVAPLTVPFTEDYFLGLTVGADPEMTPRLKLAVVGASAFALDAGNALNAQNFGGQPPSNYAPVGHTHSFGSLTGAVAVSPSANQIIQPTAAGVTPLGIKGQTGQSVPYFTVEDNGGGRLFAIMPDGHVLIPATNVLHLKNLDNDSPAGPMGDISINAINLLGDSKVMVSNPDATYKANLVVEGRVLIGNPTVSAAGLSVLEGSATDYAARFEINNASNNIPLIFGNHEGTGELIALQKSGVTQFAVNNAGNVFLKGDISKTAPSMAIDVRDTGNSVLNITNTGTGTASLQVEGATVVTSVNGIVANPSATQSIIAQNATTTPLSVKAAVSPTAPIFEVLDDASVRKFAVMPDGHVFIPGNNELHVLNINNDSPTGPMGNLQVNVMNAAADSKLVLQNSDPSFNADLGVEGKVLVGAPTVTTAKVSAYETGTANYAGSFQINNASNAGFAVYAISNGSGASVFANNTGAGKAGNFEINNATNASPAVYGMNAGTGRAAWFWVNNASNSSEAIHAITDGLGNAVLITINNASNSQPVILGQTIGTGNLLQLQQGGVNKFVVANNGNLSFGTATPVISATGAAANITLDANDAAASTVTITNSGVGVAKLSVEGGIDFNGSTIMHTGGLPTVNFDIQGGTNKTLNITNSLGGVTNLQVEGAISAFNGVNSVPVTGAAAQQLIQFGSATGSCPFTVTFSTPFTGIPFVTATKTGGGAISFATQTINSSSFQIVGCGAGSQFHWMAIGDK